MFHLPGALSLDPDQPPVGQRRQMLVLGAARRLLDFTAGALLYLQRGPRLHESLRDDALRACPPGAFDVVPALNAVQVHLDLLSAVHPWPVRLVDGFPEARSARLAHRWMQGALAGLSPTAVDLDGLLAGDIAPMERLGPCDVPLEQALQPSSRAALTVGLRLASRYEAVVVVFVRDSALVQALDADFGHLRGRVVAVVPRPGPAPEADPLVQAGYPVTVVEEGLTFETRLHQALERALQEKPDPAGRPPVVVLGITPSLGQPEALRHGAIPTGTAGAAMVDQWLRCYHAEKLFNVDGSLLPDLRVLIPPPGRGLEDALPG